jgi:hypothetical protein
MIQPFMPYWFTGKFGRQPMRQPPYQADYLQEIRKRTNKLKHFRNRILGDNGTKKISIDYRNKRKRNYILH